MSALSSNNLDKYLGLKPSSVEQDKLEYSP